MNPCVIHHQLDSHELAWAAGFFDGEGCTTSMYQSSGRQYIRCQVTQAELEPLERFRRAVGGLGRVVPRKISSLGKKPQWVYVIQNKRDVLFVLALLWPWLGSTKRIQAAHAWCKVQVGHTRWMRNRTSPSCVNGHKLSSENVKLVGPTKTFLRCKTCMKNNRRRWRVSHRDQVRQWKRDHYARRRCRP